MLPEMPTHSKKKKKEKKEKEKGKKEKGGNKEKGKVTKIPTMSRLRQQSQRKPLYN
jgi:hypothetical protein